MANLNKVMLMGNLTRDPELSYTPNNTAIARLGLAVNRKWKNAQGEMQEDVTFIDCDAWGKTAEAINQYLRKGRPIFIEGRLQLDQWQDKEGNNRSKLKVVVESFQFIDSKRDDEQGQPRQQQARPQQQRPASGGYQQPEPAHSVEDGDIPF